MLKYCIVLLLTLLYVIDGCTPKEDNVPVPVAPVVTKQPPAAPTGVVVGGQTPTSLMIWWNEVEEADSYQVYYDRTSTGSFSSMSHATKGNIVTHTGLDFYTTYYYKVRAGNSSGWGEFSESSNGRTEREVSDPNDTIAPTPANVRTGGSTASTITVSWNAEPDAYRYQVFMSQSAQGTGAVMIYDDIHTSVTVTGLASGVQRYFSVCSVNAFGPGPRSVPVPGWTVPGMMGSFNLFNKTSSTVEIKWFYPSNNIVTEFQVQRSSATSFYDGVIIYQGSLTQYIDSGLAARTPYYYRIRAGNGGGMGVWSPAQTITTYP